MSVSILREPLGRAFLGHDAVELLQKIDFMLGIPGHALAAIAELRHQRTERGEALVEIGIVALDHGHRGHGLARDRFDLAFLPFLDVQRLRDLARRVVHDRGQHHVLLDAEHFRRDLGEGLRDRLVDVPVAARFPDRIHRRGERMNEGMHVGGVEIVLFVPGRGRKHDVGIDAGRGHAEIERHQQVELSDRRIVMPDDLFRLLAAGLAQILALHAMRGAEQVLEEIFMPLAGRARADWSATRTCCAANCPDGPDPRRTSAIRRTSAPWRHSPWLQGPRPRPLSRPPADSA